MNTETINGQSDEEQIRELISNWTEAVRAKNLDGIVAHHSEDILMFDVPPPAQSKGIEAYKKTRDGFYTWFQNYRVLDIIELDIT